MSSSTPPQSLLDRLRRFDPAVLPIIVAGLVLVGAVIWLLGRPLPPAATPDPAIAGQLQELRGGVARAEALASRLAAVEARAVPAPTDVSPLQARLAALEGRDPPPAVDLSPLQGRLAALEARGAPAQVDLSPLEGRVAALQRELASRPVLDPGAYAPRAAVEEAVQRQAAAEQAMAGFAQRVAANETALAARTQLIEAQTARIAAIEQALAARLVALEAQHTQQMQRVTALEGQAQRLAALESRAARLAVIEAARSALEAGRPLGAIPNAPEALARFAGAAPPTEAALRLSFDEAARAGRAASEAATGGTMMESAVARLSGLVTVRRGEEILIGDAANGEIERARRAVDAGDLEIALRHLARLSPAAREAMRDWLGRAEALVAARAALRQLAAG